MISLLIEKKKQKKLLNKREWTWFPLSCHFYVNILIQVEKLTLFLFCMVLTAI